MYIQKLVITNVRSISHFEMEFKEPAGWHVLIGDNGAGKSSIVRAIALALIGPTDAQALRLPLINWIQKDKQFAEVQLSILRDRYYDDHSFQYASFVKSFDASVKIKKDEITSFAIGRIEGSGKKETDPFEYIWSGKKGWFSTAFGPFRRFTGGDKERSDMYNSNPKAAAHLSVFGEDVALTESLEWLSFIKFQSLEKNPAAILTLEAIKKFVNEGSLLPHGTKLVDVTSAGVSFKDGNDCEIDVTQLSDGFRSLLSMIFELIRQMVKTYGEQEVFKNIIDGKMTIDVPGVVLIDEVDAHLHPTWQTRIGQWFTQYFPNIQFIVTTHSPLICRASEKGSIWRLAAPGSEMESKEVTGTDRDRLIFGNILDAYGTEIFGESVSQSEKGEDMLKELADLNLKSIKGVITAPEKKKMQDLKKILPTAE